MVEMWTEEVIAHLRRICDDLNLCSWSKVAVAAGGMVVAVYLPYRCWMLTPRKSPLKKDYKRDVIYLYQFPRIKHVPSISPYCLKLETWLRIADLDYENVPCGWYTRSMEGTLPFVELNGVEYPDSSLVIREMTQKFNEEDVENHLDDEQRASAKAFVKLAELSLYQTVALLRYAERADEIFQQFPAKDLGFFAPIRLFWMKIDFVKRAVCRVKLTGIGKHSYDDVVRIANDDLKAISDYLGNKNYFTGIKPTAVDAALFGVLAQIVYAPYDLPQKTTIQQCYPNLMEYCERIKGQFWPDWDECTTTFTMESNWKSRA